MIYLSVTLLLFLLFLLLFPFIWFAIALDVVEVAVVKTLLEGVWERNPHEGGTAPFTPLSIRRSFK